MGKFSRVELTKKLALLLGQKTKEINNKNVRFSRTNKLTLNAGCGADWWGDIRTDVERYSTRYLKPTTANLIADVHHLPFKNDCFSITRCNHVLEHVDDPRLALKELRRVSNTVIVHVPVWHLYSFLIETVSLFYLAFFRGHEAIQHQLREISRWKERYSDHKWYIQFGNARINRLYGIPKEYEKIFHKNV